MRHWLFALIFCLGLTVPVDAAPPDGFIYTVQPGDTLVQIALRYRIAPTEIVRANRLFDPNLLLPGQQLILPGILPPLSPAEITHYHIIQPGETIFGIADRYGLPAGDLLLANYLPTPDSLPPGQRLQIPGHPLPEPEMLPQPFVAIGLSEPTIIPGRTLAVRVQLADPEATLSGRFETTPLFFYGSGGEFWGLVPIYALAEPNLYPLILTAHLPDGTRSTTFQNITIIAGSYGLENLQLDTNRSALLAYAEQEQYQLQQLWSQISPRPLWQGPFWYPVQSNRITSFFGTRRSYNGQPATGFHTGLDLAGGTGTPVYASAAGTIALAETLTVRGQAVLIDHGLGLFSGYWHLNQTTVTAGQAVERGELIGYIGSTGLVTGPHLHWEIRLYGLAVNPLQWVQESLP